MVVYSAQQIHNVLYSMFHTPSPSITAPALSIGRWSLFAVGILTAIVIFFISGIKPASAETCTFSAAADNDYKNAVNWTDCGHVPYNGDDAVIDSNSNVTSTPIDAAVKSITVNAGYTLTIYPDAGLIATSTMTVAGALSVGTGYASTTALTIGSAGSLTITTGVASTTSIDNAGTLTIGSGSVTSTGPVRGTGAITFTAGGFFDLYGNATGTTGLTAGTSTIRLLGSADQSIGGGVFYNVSSTKTGGTVSFTASSTVIGTASMNGAETWDTDTSGAGITFLSAFAVPSGSTFDIGAGAATSVSALYATGTITGGTGILTIGASFDGTGGVFTPETGTVRYASTTYANVTSTVYYNLEFSGGGTYYITASTTAIGTTTIRSSNTLSIAASQTYTGLGAFSNAGTLTVGSSASVVHAAESVEFTDSSGTSQTSYTAPTTIYITIQDSNSNTDGTAADTISVALTTDATAGSDIETVTLTETGVATGIFRGSIALVGTNAVTVSGNRIEITANGVGTAAYTDANDSSDTAGTDTASLVYAASTSGSSSASGGSGGNYSAPTYQVYSAQTQNYLNTLEILGIETSTLLKLPDDGDPNTQEDSAVYYVGTDGKRHAFPNSKVFFTWYDGFSDVQVTTADTLSNIPLGMNVTYKPGVRMVKFVTLPRVYAVGLHGVLRWVTSEAIATSLYGKDWNAMIDDISDAFFTNYTFGDDIISADDFDRAEETGGASSISVSL